MSRGGSSLGSLSVSPGFSTPVQGCGGRQKRVPERRMWAAGSRVGFGQLRPGSVPRWSMWLLLSPHTARAEPGGLAPDTASRHESHTDP